MGFDFLPSKPLRLSLLIILTTQGVKTKALRLEKVMATDRARPIKLSQDDERPNSSPTAIAPYAGESSG